MKIFHLEIHVRKKKKKVKSGGGGDEGNFTAEKTSFLKKYSNLANIK